MIDTESISFWLKHVFSIEKSSYCAVCSCKVKELLSSSFLSPHSHVILHAGLARSCRIHFFKKHRKTFSLGRRSPLSRRARVNFWMMDSATSLFGSAQIDMLGGILRRVKVFGLNKPTKRKSGAMCMSCCLMQCVMVYGWYWVHWFMINSCV